MERWASIFVMALVARFEDGEGCYVAGNAVDRDVAELAVRMCKARGIEVSVEAINGKKTKFTVVRRATNPS